MHIPDGYLSPSTCVALYAGSAPFWYTALRRVERLVHTRMVPLLSVFAAFSFIVMMFNLPLPGGTTGHAVGVAVAAIVLGPWASILAISIALAIQAIFFGDGGITALGANCFNMAIVASLSAYAIYRAVAGRSPIESRRRVVAAALAGYGSINLAALFAAVEFGIQPLLFHDASGAPLYAPYPLRIAIPAMMIGHLTVAGMAELVVSAGVVAYLQRAEPSLLASTAPNAAMLPMGQALPLANPSLLASTAPEAAILPVGQALSPANLSLASAAPNAAILPVGRALSPANPSLPSAAPRHPLGPAEAPDPAGWRATGPLWIALAILMVLTPLGILAAGSAWGEWSPEEFSSLAARQRIAAASGNRLPPAAVPAGLQRMAAFWTAPMPRYAPPFLKSAVFGYALSAMAGSGIIILVFLAVGRIFRGRAE
jgi:cobalamin biosynthesis protein CbiM